MADSKITALTAVSAAAATNTLPAVEDPSGTPVTKKVTLTQIAALFQSIWTSLQFGGATASFPMLKRSTTVLQAKLADDSAFTDVQVLEDAYAAGWNGSQAVPTKNAVYDKIEALAFSDLDGALGVNQLGAVSGYVPAWGTTVTVDFNAGNTDTTIPIVVPTGFTRYLVSGCRIFAADGSCTTATFGLFTQTGGGGFALVSSGTACLVSTASEGTGNNAQVTTVQNTGAQSYAIASQANLYFRVQTPQGVARTAKVMVNVIPLA